MPVQYVLQATNLEKLEEVLPKFMAKVYENPVFQMADVDLKFSKPEARIQINRDKASIMGVSTKNIAQTLQYGLSGQRMGYFYMNGKQYEILGEINRQQRNKPADLKAIYVRSSSYSSAASDVYKRQAVLHLQSCIVIIVLCQLPSLRDWQTAKQSGKVWMKWIRLPKKHWMTLSALPCRETRKNIVKVPPV